MIRVRALGEAVIEVGDTVITPAARIRFALLLYCAAERGRRLTRGMLSELLWPGVAERVARHSLRHAIYALREAGVPFADGRVDETVMLAAEDVALDYETRLTDSAQSAGECDEIGEFLPAYDPPLSSAYTSWLEQLRGQVNRRARDVVLRAITHARGHSHWPDVERYARLCLRFDPLNEEATLALAEATAVTGSKAAAISILDRYVADMGAGPRELRVPAAVLRTRIAERMPAPYGSAVGEGCFVGREGVLSDLTQRLDAARAGRGAGVLLVGEPGIGKSRVTLELARIAALRGFVVQRVACQRSDTRRPLSVFSDIVPGLRASPGALGCSPGSFQFLDRLTQYAPARPEPGDRASGGGGLLDRNEWDAEFLYASVRQALFDLIDAVAEEQPLLVSIDDAHWLDRVSADVARQLVERSETRPVLLVLTSRTPPPRASPLAGFVRGLSTHGLLPIDPAAAKRLLLALIGDRARDLAAAQLDRLTRLADGNPFFLRELAVHWVGHGDATDLPHSLTMAIGERLDRLAPTPMRVFQTCALVGQHATLARLEQVLSCGKVDLLDALDTLDRSGLLAGDEDRVLCKHDLLAEAAAARLSPAAARFLEHRIGITLEAELASMGQGPLLWECAQHLQAAGEVDRALRLVERHAEHVQGIGLPSEAVEIWERAQRICVTDSQHLMVSEHRVLTLMAAEEWARALAAADDVARLRAQIGLASRRHDAIELAVMEARWLVGYDIGALLQGAQECLSDPTADASHRTQAGWLALVYAYNLGDPLAVKRTYAAIERVCVHSPLSSEGRARIDLIFHCGYGDLDQATHIGEDLVARARARNQPNHLAQTLRHAAVPLRLRGRFDEAKGFLTEALDISERTHLHASAKAARFLLGELALHRGNLSEANHWLDRCLTPGVSVSEDINVTVLMAQVAILEGDSRRCEAALSRLSTLPGQPGSVRVRSNILSIAVALDLMNGAYAPNSLTATEFVGVFEQARATSGQDFAAFIFGKMLAAEGRPDEEQAAILRYLAVHRRERSALPYYLEPYAGGGADRSGAA